MGLRVIIQKKLIELFKEGIFYAVKYDAAGIPFLDTNKVIPEVICNETSASIVAKPDSSGMGYTYTNWSFTVICTFKTEVDVSDFIMGELKDITMTPNNYLVTAIAGNSMIIKHPVRQGSETGTELQITFNIKIKR